MLFRSILSGDKDFVQLHKYMNVKQYDPTRKKWIKVPNIDFYKFEHIVRGDGGDGIPNIRSGDDTFVTKGKQKPIYTKKLKEWYAIGDPLKFCDSEVEAARFERNRALIDLDLIPEFVKIETMSQYNEQKDKGRGQMFNYFLKSRLTRLMENINQF